MLIANRHRNVALLAKQGRTYTHVVILTAHGLEATKLTEDQLVSDWGQVVAYTPERAVERFQQLATSIGATEGARRLLEHASCNG
jgi:hypothetical protein